MQQLMSSKTFLTSRKEKRMKLEKITRDTMSSIPNQDFSDYAQLYIDIEENFKSQISTFGVDFAPYEKSKKEDEQAFFLDKLEGMQDKGLNIANDFKSFSLNWISPACVTCRKGIGTETFFISTQCPRNCFFCFNPNQEDYEYYLDHTKDAAAELKARHKQGIRYVDLALTGGEPLMHKKETLAFFACAQELYPDAYTRLYTSGAFLDEDFLSKLHDVKLDEIRFSVKTDDPPEVMSSTLEKIELSKKYIEAVMVEMPVMPDELDQMKSLLAELDRIGIRGINLLELCFPLEHPEEFARRGYQIKETPYRVLYDYTYAGSMPIAGSEEVCLELITYAAEENLELGIHYCSLENKFTGQVYQQNIRFKDAYPLCAMSEKDYFLKSGKAFGNDARIIREFFDNKDIDEYRYDKHYELIEFRLEHIDSIVQEYPDIALGVSYYIVEMRNNNPALREVRIDLVT